MLQKILVAIALFLLILLALSFGESILASFFSWISWITGSLVQNINDLYVLTASYVSAQPFKVVLAILLTIPAYYWLSRRDKEKGEQQPSQRKTAILLAFFLGWLGIHRFYLGKYGSGILYILLCAIYPPLAVLLGWMDAIRYFSMTDQGFTIRYSRRVS